MLGALITLSVALAPARRLSEAASTGNADCPCLTSAQRSLVTGWSDAKFVNADGTKVTLAGIDYSHPTDYGTNACVAHDAGQQPYCSKSEPPEWCADLWCYVDTATCTYPVLSSSYFLGAALKYSYATCGSKNSFASWFDDNAASDGSHAITDIADLLTGYLKDIVSTLELNQQEVSTSGATCEADSSCPCTTCTDNTVWKGSIDAQTVTIGLGDGVDPQSAAAKQDVCLASIVADSFTRIAAKEADMSRLGYEYYGSQAIGSYTQWPGLDWCLGDYDPRFRPWYAGAASGPKDVLIVIDSSGSMSGGRIDMAISAAKKVIDTLTDTDYVSVVDFSSSAVAYSAAAYGDGGDALVPATADNLEAIRTWIDGVRATGTTNFNAAFAKAWDIFRETGSASSGCNKVLLFLTDGKPNEPWGREQYADVKRQAAELDVHVMTYALGDGADASVTKQLACDARGISHVISDTSGDQLANAMASYYKLLSPMLSPCQTRWVTYTDILTQTPLLAACIATFETLDGSELTSCEGGLDGLGEEGDARVPALLGVGCIDMNLIVELDTVRARTDWPDFDARVKRERAACPRVTLTEPQLETLRRGVSDEAVCGASASSGTVTQETVVLRLVASGNVDDYPSSLQSELQQKVATAAGVDQSRVTISVEAASVIIIATITVPASTTAIAMKTTLFSSLGTADKASAALGITVEKDPTFEIKIVSSDKGDEDEGIVGLVVGLLCCLVAICVAASSVVYHCQKRKANTATSARTAFSSSTTAQAQPMAAAQAQPMAGIAMANVYPQVPTAGYPTQANAYPQVPIAQGFAMGTPVS